MNATYIIRLFILTLLTVQVWDGWVSSQDKYLPEEIPTYNIKVYGQVDPGFIFMTPAPAVAGFIDPKFGGVLLIADSVGNPVWYSYFPKTNGQPYQFAMADFNIFENSRMSFGAFNERIVLDSTLKIIDTLLCSPNLTTDNHDILWTKNGHRHMLCSEFRIMDASSLTTTNGSKGDTNALVEGAVIQEFDVNDSLIFEWKSLDHIPLTEMVDSVNFHQPGIVDFTHHNAIDIDAQGNYILSCRHLNQIVYIEKTSASIKWKLGGKSSSFALTNDSVQFTSQHDCKFTSDGTITIFDNGTYSKPPVGRMIEYKLDTVNWTADLVWEYRNKAGIHSGSRGNSQKLPNGNRFINWAFALPWDSSISIQEVDSLGNIKMDLDFMKGVLTYRAVKHEIPFKFKRAKVSYDSLNKKLSIDSNLTLQRWSTGDTANSIKIEQAGEYQAWTHYGIGYLGSEFYSVSDPFDSSWTDMITNSSARLNWTPISGAISYYLAIRKTGEPIIYIETDNAQNEYILNGLQGGTEYEWAVKALFATKSSLFCLDNYFKTSHTSHLEELDTYRVNIYPNPGIGFVTVKSNQIIESVEIYGSLLNTTKKISINDYQKQIDLTDLRTGIYILSLKSNFGIVRKKIMLIH